MATEMHWNKNKCSVIAAYTEIRRPKSSRNARADTLMGPSVSHIIIIIIIIITVVVVVVVWTVLDEDLWSQRHTELSR